MARDPASNAHVLQLDRGVYAPGQRVCATAFVNLRRPAAVTDAEASVRCREVVRGWDLVGSSRGGIIIPAVSKGKVFEMFPPVHEGGGGAPFGSGTLRAGPHVFTFEALLPQDIPPSFLRRAKNRSVRVGYRAALRLRIKGRPDWKAATTFKVRTSPGLAAGAPLAHSPHPKPGKAALSVDLHSQQGVRGLRLSGVVSVVSSRNIRVRAVRLKLVEEVKGTTSEGKHTIRRRLAFEKLEGEGPGHDIPFSLEVPMEALPSYRGIVCDVTHHLKAEADVPLGFNPTASLDVKIV